MLSPPLLLSAGNETGSPPLRRPPHEVERIKAIREAVAVSRFVPVAAFEATDASSATFNARLAPGSGR
jgi:hypothetical protein